jgi:hypothetical protein
MAARVAATLIGRSRAIIIISQGSTY